jgi:hypothetical protein
MTCNKSGRSAKDLKTLLKSNCQLSNCQEVIEREMNYRYYFTAKLEYKILGSLPVT